MARTLRRLPRPLDSVRSIKQKLAILLVASGAAGGVVFYLGIGWLPYWTSVTAIAVALVTSQLLAHGMTAPLREMTAAASSMARGDYSQRVTATSRDEVGELGRAFNLMAADLATADRQRRELIANVSHELRTPITALQSVLENVVDGVAEPDPRTLRAALEQTERLGRLVTELLDLSRLDAGVVALRPTRIAVAALLSAAVDEASVAGRPVTFDVTVEPPDLAVEADPARLHQVVANLLDNASRHSPAGGRVEVGARALGQEGGLLLEVADSGPGIPSDERERVFDRFTRGGSPSAGRDGGTGLGLAIARWAVDLHHGTISVPDPADRGCLIRVTLPPVPPEGSP